MPEASLPSNKLVMNAFEALLDQSGLLRANQTNNQLWTVLLRYVTTLFFVSALSRVGLSHQLETNDPSSFLPRPDLECG
jgi:hypothetical protein